MTVTHGTGVTIDSIVPTLSPVSISANHTPAGRGTEINLTFTSSEALATGAIVATIAQETAQVICTSATACTATHIVDGNDKEGPVDISIVFADIAGNTGLQVDTTTDASTATIDITPPKILAVRMQSNTADSTVAVTDSIISLLVTTSEPIQTPTIQIAGRPATVSCAATLVPGNDTTQISATLCTATVTVGAGDAD
eukprot:COSAG01_NODE_19346_length_1015_cov_3.664847_1_plen_197_part_10